MVERNRNVKKAINLTKSCPGQVRQQQQAVQWGSE